MVKSLVDVFPIWGTFGYGGTTASAGTAFTFLVPPLQGPGGSPPVIYSLAGGSSGTPNWMSGMGVIRINTLIYSTAGTQHTIAILRPLNYTTVKTAVAPSGTVFTLTDDPGIYSANYRYQHNDSLASAQVADHGIAANDYVAYQLADGTWASDKVASVSGLNVTMTTGAPNVTGGGVAALAVLFYFGVSTLKDPANGQLQFTTTTTANASREQVLADKFGCGPCALHPGDPLLFVSPNNVAAGSLDLLAGVYSEF